MSSATNGSRVALSAPRLRVLLGDPDTPDGWVEVVVQTFQPDMVAAEEMLGRNKIKFQDAPIAAQAATAYFALKRKGHPAAASWDEFLPAALEVTEAEDQVAADPTSPAASNGP